MLLAVSTIKDVLPMYFCPLACPAHGGGDMRVSHAVAICTALQSVPAASRLSGRVAQLVEVLSDKHHASPAVNKYAAEQRSEQYDTECVGASINTPAKSSHENHTEKSRGCTENFC